MMKLIKTKSEFTTEKAVPGLLEVEIKHKIESSQATLVYGGPKIPPLVWEQILSFFKWTYDTAKSESQVRLYVNPTILVPTENGDAVRSVGTWSAWAYPQEARTGMSSKELDTPEAKEQRALFPDGDGWLYFGTVHHHCSAGAFQSGTDENNEKNQDGLHITIGNMGRDRYDMHARFYLSGLCWDPDMSLFWQIGPDLAALLPHDIHDRVARHQMCAPSSALFPDQWKANYIEVRREAVSYTGANFPGSTGYGHYSSWSGFGSHSTATGPRPTFIPLWKRAVAASEALAITARVRKWPVDEVVNNAASMNDGIGRAIKIIMKIFQVEDITDICRELTWEKAKFVDLYESKREGTVLNEVLKEWGLEMDGVLIADPNDDKGKDTTTVVSKPVSMSDNFETEEDYAAYIQGNLMSME